jgi:hypothetical protein
VFAALTVFMKLSASELTALRKLEKQLADQFKYRWVFLIFGILLIGMSLGLYTTHLITGTLAWASSLPETPPFYLQSIFGGLSVGLSIKGFKGDPQKELLLRVINELQTKNS